MSTDPKAGFSTRAIHAGNPPDSRTGAVAVPVYQTSTYAQEGLGKNKGYEYARSQNPTREALEANLASLENGVHGLCYGSGLAATTNLLCLLKAGDHVVASNNMYGGTFRLFDQVFGNFGLTVTYVDSSDLGQVEAAIVPATKLLYVETPTNPLLTITDLAGIAQISAKHRLISACDNTFATPYLQRPLEFGIDIVLHSTTKYLNGHSDMVGGSLIVKRDDLGQRLRFLQNAVGAVPGPWDCWLALRGTKTLSMRMDRHQANAAQIASYLAGEKKVKRLFYPGLPNHPGHALAKRQMSGFGGIVTLDLGDLAGGKRFAEALRLFTLAESLGGVESLVTHPASMTHASVPKAQRESTGFTDGLVRLSVGCEDAVDLLADVSQALAAV